MLGEALAERVHDVDDFSFWRGRFGLGQGLAFSLRVDQLHDGGFVVVFVGGEVELRRAALNELFGQRDFLGGGG